MEEKDILEALSKGELSPSEAIESYEIQASHISEIDVVDEKAKPLESGFKCFDDELIFTRGSPDLIVVGARPSHGKSAFCFQVAQNVSKKHNVLIFSLEMDKKSIVRRMVAGLSGWAPVIIKKGEAPKADVEKALKEIAELKFWINDKILDAKSIRSAANAFHRRHPLDLVVIDYLQRIKTTGKGNRNEEVGEISSELKALAKDLNCPVLAAAQLNRQIEWRGKQTQDYSPQMADLKDSGNIEADADVIIFLGRQEIYDGSRPGTADFIIGKNRNGITATFTMSYFGGKCQFVENQFAAKPKPVHTNTSKIIIRPGEDSL